MAARRAGSSTLNKCAPWCGVAATLALIGATSGARAGPDAERRPPLLLGWAAPSDCPPAAVVEAEVLAIVGAAPSPGPELLATVVVVQRGDGQYEATAKPVLQAAT
ncbi:MAG TPA: hypothetical protein PLU22_25220, partial [Polyangiaceae bacterium]|nr:hypothetical protein [Polyangiaceae bacterium]